MGRTKYRSFALILGLLGLLLRQPVRAQSSGPPPQPADLIYNEMRTVYLGNLARRDNGVPPMRWNAEMTEAARWFSWDSVENQPPGFCGHLDSLGRWPSERVPSFGYLGNSWAENAFCGYVTPEQAIEGWMNSTYHRENLLNLDSWEVGLGYYLRAEDGRGYVTQDFGMDPLYPPLIIENEAISTDSPEVNLYLYGNADTAFGGVGPTVEMMLANEPCFAGASWEPYRAESSWTLEPGLGWRTVYAKVRDAVGRTTVVSDTIYLGDDVPLDELGLHLASATHRQVTVYELDGNDLPYFQLSQNWFADDTLLQGNGERVNDPDALGGTAYRLFPGDGESRARVWTTDFGKDTPFVAYFRLKVNDNTSDEEVARISVKSGGIEYGPFSLKGTDFDAANVYQEFPIPFTFHDNPEDGSLFFNFWHSGQADVYVDGVYIFTEPYPVQSSFTWDVPGGHYRGGGIWLRYTDNAGSFSPVEDAVLIPRRISALPMSISVMAEVSATTPTTRTLTIERKGCEPFGWDVGGNAPWLTVQPEEETVRVVVDPREMAPGEYRASITIQAESGVIGSPIQVPVTLLVVEQIHRQYLPAILRAY